MPRPHKQRRIQGNPNSFYFKPQGIPLRQLEEINLTIDEFEALRLKDVEKLDQNQAADQMCISQPTFHRLLQTAREKIAIAIVEAKAIRVDKAINSKVL